MRSTKFSNSFDLGGGISHDKIPFLEHIARETDLRDYRPFSLNIFKIPSFILSFNEYWERFRLPLLCELSTVDSESRIYLRGGSKTYKYCRRFWVSDRIYGRRLPSVSYRFWSDRVSLFSLPTSITYSLFFRLREIVSSGPHLI